MRVDGRGNDMPRRKDHPFRASFRSDPFGWATWGEKGHGFGHVGAVHKGRMAERPYRFVNELVCGSLAQFLRLPIPPFAMTFLEKQAGVELKNATLFSSVDFNYERDELPPPDSEACMQHMPSLCAGVLLFDIFVANPDRRREHIWCDDPSKPSRMLIFDHDFALFGGEDAGATRLEELKDGLGLRFAANDDDYHPFLGKITSARLFDDWYNRIYTTPEWFIREICQETKAYGMSKQDSEELVTFLTYRSQHLEEIVGQHKSAFSGIQEWREGLF
jgi:hypothetical protein